MNRENMWNSLGIGSTQRTEIVSLWHTKFLTHCQWTSGNSSTKLKVLERLVWGEYQGCLVKLEFEKGKKLNFLKFYKFYFKIQLLQILYETKIWSIWLHATKKMQEISINLKQFHDRNISRLKRNHAKKMTNQETNVLRTIKY
jgi:hypothetical protein